MEESAVTCNGVARTVPFVYVSASGSGIQEKRSDAHLDDRRTRPGPDHVS
jgi:hypothetical protein